MGRSKAERAATVERRRRAVEMRRAGHQWDTIAEQLGYAGKAAACKDVIRAMQANRDALAEEVEQVRAAELDHLDALRQRAWKVMETPHVLVNAGQIVMVGGCMCEELGKKESCEHPPPVPLPDDAPVLHAIDRLLKISQQRARLIPGVEAPVQVEQTGKVRYSIEGVDLDQLT